MPVSTNSTRKNRRESEKTCFAPIATFNSKHFKSRLSADSEYEDLCLSCLECKRKVETLEMNLPVSGFVFLTRT